MNAANVDANGFHPRTWIPTAAAIICCSAMYISKYRSGCASRKISANVEFETSPSSATTSPRPSPSALSASPYALRVATSSPTSYVGRSSAPTSNRCGSPSNSALGTSTTMLRIPPSSSIASVGSSSALPWKPFSFSTAFTPLPLIVFATITVGVPVVSSASAYAASIASTSCPSISIACQPKACARFAYESRSQPCIVSPRWPSRFTSMTAIRLSSFSCQACSNASHIEPSAISLSPQSTHTRYGSLSSRFPASAMPTPYGNPWPSEPVATSTQGSTGTGCPSSLLPNFRNVSSSS